MTVSERGPNEKLEDMWERDEEVIASQKIASSDEASSSRRPRSWRFLSMFEILS